MNKLRKRVIKVVMLVGLVFGLAVQVSATPTAWRTYRIPSGQSTVFRDINNNLLMQRTAQITSSNAISRQVRVDSQNQTMWSNPQVQLHRSTEAVANNSAGTTVWDRPRWHSVSNNNYVRFDMPFPAGLSYSLRVRSAWNQVGTDGVAFRMNVQRFRNQ